MDNELPIVIHKLLFGPNELSYYRFVGIPVGVVTRADHELSRLLYDKVVGGCIHVLLV